MKPFFRTVLAPREEFQSDEGYALHLAEERERVWRNRTAVEAACEVLFIVACIGAFGFIVYANFYLK